MRRKLTPKQQKFSDEYIKSGNAAEAARNAGYSKRTAAVIGNENLIKPYIKEYIDKRMQELADKRLMGAREAVELLTRIARGEETETVFVATSDGSVEQEEKAADLKTKISAVKEILKRYPNDDKLLNAQLRKLNAEADIAEGKAAAANKDTDSQMKAMDKLLGLIEGGTQDDKTK